MRAVVRFLVVCAAVGGVGRAQWVVQNSGTTADLRGIDAVSRDVAWASGKEGTVLKTVDGGQHWVKCAVPPGAEALDFRGVQAFDDKTAIVMSSGPGDASRLYKTVDGCGSWKLVATNPDKEGFWDVVKAADAEHASILGDSVASKVRLWEWNADSDDPLINRWSTQTGARDEGSFAASNSVLEVVATPQLDPVWKYELRWASQSKSLIFFNLVRTEHTATCEPCQMQTKRTTWKKKVPSESSGIFSFFFRDNLHGVAVGGDYKKPDKDTDTAGQTNDGGQSWAPAQTRPHGYRSAVAYDASQDAWITVGPNGTDVSFDDGKNWRALKPSSGDAPDADRDWNALSLPFVVGPKGRIGVLREGAIEGVRAR